MDAQRPSAILLLAVLGLGVAASKAHSEELSGRVASLDDDPLPGVIVNLSSANGGIARRTVVTDGAGAFRAVGLSPGTYRLAFELPGFDRREGEILVAPGQPARFDMVLPLSPRSDLRICICDPVVAPFPPERIEREWRVRVLDTAHQLMPDAVVEVPALGLSVRTESDGAACFWAPDYPLPVVRVTVWPFRSVEMDLCCVGIDGAVMVGETDLRR